MALSRKCEMCGTSRVSVTNTRSDMVAVCSGCFQIELTNIELELENSNRNICPRCERKWNPDNGVFGQVLFCGQCEKQLEKSRFSKLKSLQKLTHFFIKPEKDWLDTELDSATGEMVYKRVRNRKKNELRKQKKAGPKKPPEPVRDPVLDAGNPLTYLHNMLLIQQIKELIDKHDYDKARTYCLKALSMDPKLTEAYTSLGLIGRRLGDYDSAIANYTKAIEFDLENSRHWVDRAGMKTRKAVRPGKSPDPGLMEEAHNDYSRAIELKPDEETYHLQVIELEICMGRYRDAIGTAGTCWKMAKSPSSKLACAWLGAVAQILAGRPQRKWAHLKDYLEDDINYGERAYWEVAEIKRYLDSLKRDGFESKKLDKAFEIHELFSNYLSNEQFTVL